MSTRSRIAFSDHKISIPKISTKRSRKCFL